MKASGKPTAKSRILVVDDHPLFREGLVQFINRQQDLICCGEASTLAAARPAVMAHKPDLLLLDLRLKDGDGLELIKSLRAQDKQLPILVLSQMDETVYAERALRAGARGYVMKEEATEEVLNAIRAVLRAELYVSRKISVLVLRKQLESKPENRGNSSLSSLTDRELQVFQMLGSGLSTRRVATELNLSVKTIETYRENLKHKLALQSGTQLIRRATEWVHGEAPRKSK